MTQDDLIALLPGLRQQLTRYARSRHPESIVEDAVQETLLHLHRTSERIEADDAVAWAIGIFRNVVRRAGRDGRRHDHLPLHNPETGEAIEIPVPAGQETGLLARRALALVAALPEERRRLYLDVVVGGETIEDAARSHGLAAGTVKSRVHRTGAALRAELEGRQAPRWRRAG
jgi:RNA polymerase sigma-70 factor (ECF subfamily)